MDKTINVNLGGTLFRLDEDAYKILLDYMNALNNRFAKTTEGNEIIEDIEARISEIFLSTKGIAGIITKQNVESMITMIGKPEEFETPGGGEHASRNVSVKKRLYRSMDDSVISGVCGGLGVYFNTDPLLFRILFVIFSIFFLAGFILYIGLWIAVPAANTEVKRREMYGDSYRQAGRSDGYYQNRTKFSNSLDEILKAFGRVFFLIFRIIMIIIGSSFVITSSILILTFVMVFIFKLPGSFTADGFDYSISYLPEMLKYVVDVSMVPWIKALLALIIVLPLLAIAYWGVRMIFWLKVRDGFVNLAGFIIWIMAIAALSIILFNEGTGFAESAKTVSGNALSGKPDTLFVITANKMENIEYERELMIPDESYNNVIKADSSGNIYIKPRLRLTLSDAGIKTEITKRSSGRTRNAAVSKSESLVYNHKMSNDTIYLDDYFVIPGPAKWTGDFVTINLLVPERTVLYFDNGSEKLFHEMIEIDDSEKHYNPNSREHGNRYWVLTDDGLEEAKIEDSRSHQP